MAETSRTDRPCRVPAEPLKPVVDPAGWHPDELAGNEDWAAVLDEAEIADVREAVGAAEARGTDIISLRREDFPLPRLGPRLAEIRRELVDGRGFVQMRGLPVADMTRRQAAIAFWGIGTYFGAMLSQNAEGHLLGHVKDLGKDYDDPMVRGYQTKAAMGFHNDPCDFVALLCVRTAKSGGESRVASSVTIYNEMLKRRPDLVAALVDEFYWTRHGELPPGAAPWFKLPIFAFRDGYFCARGVSSHIMKAQGLPGVPPLTEAQKEAFALFRELAVELAADLPFREGDLQILNNHVLVHSRRPYEDWPEPDRKRHLFRLWLRDPGCRPVPDATRENFDGIEVEGFRPWAPLDAEQAA